MVVVEGTRMEVREQVEPLLLLESNTGKEAEGTASEQVKQMGVDMLAGSRLYQRGLKESCGDV